MRQSFLMLKDGTRLMLDYQHNPSGSRAWANELEMQQSIAQFLGIPSSGGNWSDHSPLDDAEVASVRM